MVNHYCSKLQNIRGSLTHRSFPPSLRSRPVRHVIPFIALHCSLVLSSFPRYVVGRVPCFLEYVFGRTGAFLSNRRLWHGLRSTTPPTRTWSRITSCRYPCGSWALCFFFHGARDLDALKILNTLERVCSYLLTPRVRLSTSSIARARRGSSAK